MKIRLWKYIFTFLLVLFLCLLNPLVDLFWPLTVVEKIELVSGTYQPHEYTRKILTEKTPLPILLIGSSALRANILNVTINRWLKEVHPDWKSYFLLSEMKTIGDTKILFDQIISNRNVNVLIIDASSLSSGTDKREMASGVLLDLINSPDSLDFRFGTLKMSYVASYLSFGLRKLLYRLHIRHSGPYYHENFYEGSKHEIYADKNFHLKPLDFETRKIPAMEISYLETMTPVERQVLIAFAKRCRELGVKLLILVGPNQASGKWVDWEVGIDKELDAKFIHVSEFRYISDEKQKAESFIDQTHLEPEAGERYTRALLPVLEGAIWGEP